MRLRSTGRGNIQNYSNAESLNVAHIFTKDQFQPRLGARIQQSEGGLVGSRINYRRLPVVLLSERHRRATFCFCTFQNTRAPCVTTVFSVAYDFVMHLSGARSPHNRLIRKPRVHMGIDAEDPCTQYVLRYRVLCVLIALCGPKESITYLESVVRASSIPSSATRTQNLRSRSRFLLES